MAVIVPFKARPPRAASEIKPDVTGQILFFTGVRYERHDESRPGPATPTFNDRSGSTRRTRRRA
jgi:hypothetical protein